MRVRIEDLVALATRLDIRVVRYSRNLVQKCFAPFGATTRFEIALVIARELPELASRRPRKRKLWMSEDARMPLFDAAALALTFFYCQSRSGTR